MSDCERCAAKDAVIAELVRQLGAKQQSPWPVPSNETVTWRTGRDTSRCPCRPENGGSGVCNCTLGGTTITCNVSGNATAQDITKALTSYVGRGFTTNVLVR